MDDAREILEDPLAAVTHRSAEVRRLAVAMLSDTVDHLGIVVRCLEDPAPRVRAAAAEALGSMGPAALSPLMERTGIETEDTAVEALAFALGEIGDAAAVPWLMRIASRDHDTLTRETAVASLGAIGDEEARPLLLHLVGQAPPQVRRRAVVALSVYEGDEVEEALLRARSDRNPMVREAADMLGP